MKPILLIMFGMILGIFLVFLLFKKVDLVTVMKIHGLKYATAPKALAVFSRSDYNNHINLPKDTKLYLVEYPPESLSRYIVFINVEGPDLEVKRTDVIDPLSAYVEPVRK